MVEVVADGPHVHGQTLQGAEDTRRGLGRDQAGPHLQDAVNGVSHVETVGKVVVDHIAVTLLHR